MSIVTRLRLRSVQQLLFPAAFSLLLFIGDSHLIAEQEPHEQVGFAMEGGVVHPVKLTEEAIRVMRQNKVVQDCLEEGQSKDSISGTWFVASEVHLSATGEASLVVMPSASEAAPDGACLLNAHTMPFWILLKTGGTYTVVLEDNVQVLTILSTFSHRYSDIETTAATSTKPRSGCINSTAQDTS
jgi:hypothetical protein